MKIGEKIKICFGENEIVGTIIRVNDESVDVKRNDNGKVINFEKEYIKPLN